MTLNLFPDAILTHENCLLVERCELLGLVLRVWAFNIFTTGWVKALYCCYSICFFVLDLSPFIGWRKVVGLIVFHGWHF